MPSIRYDFKVEFEDGAELPVTADQRDVAAWEIQPFGTSGTELKSRAYTAFRFMAYNALRRQGLVDKAMGWKTFSDQCVEVTFAKVDEDEAAPDPGLPVRPDASSST